MVSCYTLCWRPWTAAWRLVPWVLAKLSAVMYMSLNDQLSSRKGEEGQTARLSSEKQEASNRAWARMAVDHRSPTADQKSASGFLQWNINHSVRRDIGYYLNSWLTILQPGDYYVYSTVTFSGGDPLRPLVSRVKLRHSEKEEDAVVMQAYCSLSSGSGSPAVPRLCTATQGAVITLERGNQLAVWVQDLLLVDYEDGATTFGMYKL
ncbi:CD40 ligand isoform 2-T2 [Spinachia spinachia]